MGNSIRYSVIVPVFNEEAVLLDSYYKLCIVLNTLAENYEIIFVNDGSTDKSKSILEQLCAYDNHIKVLHFSRNFGHQMAITAGIDYANGKAVIIIDADLQDPPELIPQMIQKWQKGYHVVFGQRIKRKGETIFKKWSAAFFYRLLSKLTDVDIPVDTGDFRLMDQKVVNAFKSLQEKNPFVRGQVSWLGFRQTEIKYEREPRNGGKTKYPLKKMIRLSLDGLTSFSYKPLKLATYLGSLTSLIGFSYLFIVLVQKLFTDSTLTGWASLIIIQLIFGGLILLILGVIGEYIGRIYEESKNRPRYIIEETNGFDVANSSAILKLPLHDK